jgi:hypothetical protein
MLSNGWRLVMILFKEWLKCFGIGLGIVLSLALFTFILAEFMMMWPALTLIGALTILATVIAYVIRNNKQ